VLVIVLADAIFYLLATAQFSENRANVCIADLYFLIDKKKIAQTQLECSKWSATFIP